jgi:hypothetical protein
MRGGQNEVRVPFAVMKINMQRIARKSNSRTLPENPPASLHAGLRLHQKLPLLG